MTAELHLVRAAIDRKGWAVVRASGRSMEPTIVPPTALRLTPRAFSEVRVGEVIAFDQDGAMVVHRVVARDQETLYTAGDGRLRIDSPVRRQNFIGVADQCPPRPERRLSELLPPPADFDLQTAPFARVWAFDPLTASTTLPRSLLGRQVEVIEAHRPGFGLLRADVDGLRQRHPGGRVRIAVCPSAVLTVEDLDALPWRRYPGLELFVGVGSGDDLPLSDGTYLLHEEVSDLTVRVGEPRQIMGTSDAVDRVTEALARWIR